MDRERRQVVGQTRRGRGVLPAELADEGPQAMLGLGWRRGGIERRPVRRPDPGVEPGALGQLGQDVPKAMDRTPTAVGVGPQLGDRPDQARCSVAHDEKRAPQAAPDEAVAEIEPVLDPLPLTETHVEQDPLPVGREAPRDEDALLTGHRAGPAGRSRRA